MWDGRRGSGCNGIGLIRIDYRCLIRVKSQLTENIGNGNVEERVKKETKGRGKGRGKRERERERERPEKKERKREAREKRGVWEMVIGSFCWETLIGSS
jgi:hypothetical protein